jgi:hypothetical protein
MPTAEARVHTDRASRYLHQLRSHLGNMGHMRHKPAAHHGGQMPPKIEHVDYSDTYGSIRFAGGLCTLHATADTLTVRVETDDEDTLQRIQNGLTGRLEKIGRRDQLTVTWQRPQAATTSPREAAAPTPAPQSGAVKLQGRGKKIGLIAGGALVVAAHLGLFGAALATSTWASWVTNGILALIVLKLVFMGVHLVLGRRGIRQGKNAMAHRRQRHTTSERTAVNPHTSARP